MGRGRVLVMDDEDFIKDLVGSMLDLLGYEAELARDGAQAIHMYSEALAKGRRYDAIIMDLTIPGGMGGKEAIKDLLRIDPTVKAIVSSGYSNDPIMSNFKDFGFAGVVTTEAVPDRRLAQRHREGDQRHGIIREGETPLSAGILVGLRRFCSCWLKQLW